MSVWELISIAVGLSMDAFAVSICKGLAMKQIKFKHMLIVGLWFGGFQALMPLIGYFLGIQFETYITAYDHWIAFILLALIGGNMIKEALSNEEETADASLAVKIMLVFGLCHMHRCPGIGCYVCIFAGEYLGGCQFYRCSYFSFFSGRPENRQCVRY